MIQKCAHALGVLKEYTRELQILDELLAQRFWRRGRRGKWYERRALILMVHCETRKEEQTSRRAMEGVAEGLLDEDTHMGRFKIHCSFPLIYTRT
jgi:Fanconi-associated nuclease 1